jgi:hypothetical protein
LKAELAKVAPGSRESFDIRAITHLPSAPPELDAFRQLIIDKSTKRIPYPRPICLVIYFNHWWFERIGEHKTFEHFLLSEHEETPFEGVEKFDRVLVLNCSMRALIELAPNPCVIVAEVRWNAGASWARRLPVPTLYKNSVSPLVPKLQFGNALRSETLFRMEGVSAGGERLDIQTRAALARRSSDARSASSDALVDPQPPETGVSPDSA